MIYDVAIAGGGIAGASLAAELAPHARVVLIEAEETPGYHSTGRSAAFWHETLGGPLVRPLTRASYVALAEGGHLKPRVSLEVATCETVGMLDKLAADFAGSGIRLLPVDADGIQRRVPRARPVLVAGLVEPDCADIDVGGLHAACLSAFRRAGGIVLTGTGLDSVRRIGDVWQLCAGNTELRAQVLVNAAGAWADTLAGLAGVRPLGIQPKRRTIVQVRVTTDDVPDDLPLVMDIAGQYYFRPQGLNRLWLCPHDETPVDPHDVAPEDIDVALAIDRFESVTDWKVASVERKWAGLRSFAPDRLPVYGFDPRQGDFFWCAGQGGFGIQTAPAAAAMCAHLILGRGATLSTIDPAVYDPGRFG